MDLHRLRLKLFLAEGAALRPEEVVPVFHRWIQEHVIEGILIDVADYRHVHRGPGVLLVGHEADRALDLSDGRPGLLFTQKRVPPGDLAARLRGVFRGALLAARALEAEPSLKGKARFRTDEAELSFADRLRVPNDAGTLEGFRPELEPVLKEVLGAKATLQRVENDPRALLTARIAAPGAPGIADLLARLA